MKFQDALIEFEADDHTYKREGLVVPGVTSILDPLNTDKPPEHILREAYRLGTSVHEHTEYFDKGWLRLDYAKPRIRPYVDAWIAFLRDSRFEIEAIELKVYSDRYHYAGRLDRIGMMGGKRTLIDIKCGPKILKSYGPQTAAYCEAVNERLDPKERIKKRLCVHLLNSGKYKPQEMDKKTDFNVFLAALTVHNFAGPRSFIPEL